MNRKLLLSLALSLSTALSSAAFGAPVLRSEAVIHAPVVTVGDLFKDAGVHAKEPMFRAPPVGTNGTVTLDQIAAAAKRIGLTDYAIGAVQSVWVSHPGVEVNEALLSELITTEAAASAPLGDGVDAAVRFNGTLPALVAEDVAAPVRLLSFGQDAGTGVFNARFAVAGVEQPLTVTGKIELTVAVPHLAQTLPAGAVIGPSDIELRPVPVRFADASGVLRMEDVVGKQLERASRAGVLLKTADLSEPLAVTRNDQVTLYFKQGPLTLTVKGQALNAAALGATVNVLNSMSKRVVTGVATGKGAVEVRSGAAINVAGL